MRAEKKSMVEELRARVGGSAYLVLADYRGLTVAQTTDLRGRLRPVRAEFHVVQNRLFGHVARELSQAFPDAALRGPTALVLGAGDMVETARVLRDFMKDSERLSIKAARFEGRALSAEDFALLATLPSKKALQASLVGTLAAPMSHLVGVMHQKLSSLLYVVRAIQEKREKEQQPA